MKKLKTSGQSLVFKECSSDVGFTMAISWTQAIMALYPSVMFHVCLYFKKKTKNQSRGRAVSESKLPHAVQQRTEWGSDATH